MPWDDLDGWEAVPIPEELPPFTDDEIAVYEALDRLWHIALRQGRRWVTPNELRLACPQFEPRTVQHHVVWLNIQNLITWDLAVLTADGVKSIEAVGYAPSELPPPWRHDAIENGG